MKSVFAQYKMFQHEDDLLGFIDRLELHNIPYETSKYASGLDHTYLGAGAGVEYSLKIPRDKFKEMNRIIEKEAEEDFHQLPPEYFLFDFSDEELKEVISSPGDWFRKDVVYAGKILENRGISFSISEIREQVNREKQLRLKPKKANTLLLIMAYALTPASIFLGFWPASFSIFTGIYLAFWKGTDEAGKRYWVFDHRSRIHGAILLTMGSLLCLAFWGLAISGNLPGWMYE